MVVTVDQLVTKAGLRVRKLEKEFNKKYGQGASVKLLNALFLDRDKSTIIGTFAASAHSFLVLYVMNKALNKSRIERHNAFENFKTEVHSQHYEGRLARAFNEDDLHQTIGNALQMLKELKAKQTADHFTVYTTASNEQDSGFMPFSYGANSPN